MKIVYERNKSSQRVILILTASYAHGNPVRGPVSSGQATRVDTN
jgi:hypothetical protein